ncbi:MAG: hypothetical protein ACLTBV_11465 [Enterocloster bolteae]
MKKTKGSAGIIYYGDSGMDAWGKDWNRYVACGLPLLFWRWSCCLGSWIGMTDGEEKGARWKLCTYGTVHFPVYPAQLMKADFMSWLAGQMQKIIWISQL